MFRDYINIAVRNIRSRSLRSWLTILGIVIGVFLIISLISLSEGIKSSVLKELRMMGNNLIMVFPGQSNDLMATFMGGMELNDEDVKAIRETKGVDSVIPMVWKSEMVRYGEKKKVIFLYAISWRRDLDLFKSQLGWSLEKGHWPAPRKREIVVGSLVAKDIFPDMKIGSEANIAGRKFKVVGILNSLGSKQDDSMVGIDSDIFRDITGKRKGAQFALVVIKPGFAPAKVAEQIKSNLKQHSKRIRGKDSSSFSVLTSDKVSGIVGNIMSLIQTLIFSLASIAIVVGAIGIMNTMYTSVQERIREIGVMKAIGARNSTISNIFLIESGIMGLIGGIGGVILGIGLAKIVEIFFQIHPIFYLKASITPSLIIFGLLFSFLLGCLSGLLPARRAARLKPVDALRYE
ncbi:ABC transporter permease [bacterium]|nr:ABC transporter permease [bacterium]